MTATPRATSPANSNEGLVSRASSAMAKPWRRTFKRALGRPELTFDEAWELVRAGRAPALHPSVRSPAVRDSRHRLRAAYAAVPMLASLHEALPGVVVEGSSVDISDHLDGDYWPDKRLIRIECHHPIDIIAFTLLHEFAHAVDHLTLTDVHRTEFGHAGGALGWRDPDANWEDRGEEWFAESFAHWWWPARVEESRPGWRLRPAPLEPPRAKRAFDLSRMPAASRRVASRQRTN